MRENRLGITENKIKAFCHRWKIAELALFGSVMREDFNMNSDVDVLVSFSSGVVWSLLEQIKMNQELSELIGRKVDLISKRAIEKNQNWIIRNEILNSAETIYAA